MKKIYTTPVAREVKIENRYILMASVNPDAILSNDRSIKYGGIDTEGILDPAGHEMNMDDEDDWE